MHRVQETCVIGYSRYYLESNSNNRRMFFVYTLDPSTMKNNKTYHQLTQLAKYPVDELLSSLIQHRDFNYIENDDIQILYDLVIPEEEKI
jgi:hypothetical protein